jgi:hypothetical protein
LPQLPSDFFKNQKDEAGEESFFQFNENGDRNFLNEKKGEEMDGIGARTTQPEASRREPDIGNRGTIL